jgi:hypothetical protein
VSVGTRFGLILTRESNDGGVRRNKGWSFIDHRVGRRRCQAEQGLTVCIWNGAGTKVGCMYIGRRRCQGEQGLVCILTRAVSCGTRVGPMYIDNTVERPTTKLRLLSTRITLGGTKVGCVYIGRQRCQSEHRLAVCILTIDFEQRLVCILTGQRTKVGMCIERRWCHSEQRLVCILNDGDVSLWCQAEQWLVCILNDGDVSLWCQAACLLAAENNGWYVLTIELNDNGTKVGMYIGRRR